jgi:hypothetical protein
VGLLQLIPLVLELQTKVLQEVTGLRWLLLVLVVVAVRALKEQRQVELRRVGVVLGWLHQLLAHQLHGLVEAAAVAN